MSAKEQYGNEKYDDNDSMYSKELMDVEYKSPHITYNFEEENNTGISISNSNFGTSTEYSVNNEQYGLLSDYLNLKEKFIDLQNQYETLMHELEEKTKVLDNTISLLKDSKGIFEKDVAVISMRGQNSSIDVKASAPRNCEIVSENKKSQKLDSLSKDETKTDSDICMPNGDNKYCQEIEGFGQNTGSHSVSSKDGRILSSSSKSSRMEALQIAKEDDKPIAATPNGHTYPSLERRTFDNINFPTQEVSFLFTRRKCHQTHSAPNRMNGNFGYNLNIYQTCISTPLSAKKDSLYSQYFPLNFSKVKEHLIYGKRDVKELLLQALRWRLTQSSYTERASIIYSYIQSDLLDLRKEESIMDLLSQDSNDKEFLEGLARLMNTIASLKEGRDYICFSKNQVRSNIVSSVSKQLETSLNISLSLEMQIVILQKLSIRKEQRKVMIVNGLLQSISKLLINRRSELSAYCMEYTFALFMNLCLEEEAKLKCSEDPSYIIQVFFCLLDEVQDNYMPYVTGALYSILSEKSVEEEALKQDLDVLLFRQMKSTKDKYLRKQLEFIIRARFRGEGAKFTCNENVPSEEIDILEPELDRDDSVRGPVQGEKFLEMYRLNEAHLEVTNKCNSCTEVKSSSETKENTSQTESHKSIGVVEEGTNMESNDPTCKIEAAKIKFDAEISTSTENLDAFQNTIPVSSLLEYAQKYRPDVLSPTLGPCSCLGRSKYNCGCYEAIKRSVDEDEELVGIILKDNKLQPDEIISDEVNSSMLENCSNKQEEDGLPIEFIEMTKKS